MIRLHLLLLAALLFTSTFTTPVSADWPGKKSDWKGHERFDFNVDSRPAYVVIPKEAAKGNPWVWRARFPSFHAEADLLLLERGFHIAYINTDNMLGSPRAMGHWDKFYDFMVEHGMSPKVALEGVSRGGLFVYGWASRHPDRVACIYADTPVCDIKSWPGGKGKGIGSAGSWKHLQEEYGFTEAEAMAYDKNPIDILKPIAEAKIPILHIVSLSDVVVPPTENTFILAERYRKLGGEFEIIEVKEGTEQSHGHHFTHPDPKKVADFIEKYAAEK
ncbi:prolyl oligopeptidase family serine peptidase [bacterium]|nr:prolyl oligopeptidase family serine peptidase [bacterium]